jgi:hypothetical protein
MPLTSSAAEAQRVTEQTYDLTALIPSTCNFSLELAVAHFRPIEIGGPPIRAELLTSSSVQKLDGFRVWFGDWAVSAWLDEAADVAELCQFLAQKNDLPTPAETIAACKKSLSISTDDDPQLNHSDDIIIFAQELTERFGLLVYDPVNGSWWT